MSQLKKPHILYHNFTFALLLLLFAFLSHIALGILDNYLANALSILALGLLLFTLRKHSNKLFLIVLIFIFAITFSYIPSGILYGPASIGVIASVYETNFSETLGFLRAMPSSIYIFILVYLLVLLILRLHLLVFAKFPKEFFHSFVRRTKYLLRRSFHSNITVIHENYMI